MKSGERESSRLEDPPEDFCRWWHPHGRDNQSGADIGGHPDAERVWARKDTGRWVHRTYGTTARIAWNSQNFRSAYDEWVQLGRPEREDFISLAATLERQKQFWKDLKSIPRLFDRKSTEFQPY